MPHAHIPSFARPAGSGRRQDSTPPAPIPVTEVTLLLASRRVGAYLKSPHSVTPVTDQGAGRPYAGDHEDGLHHRRERHVSSARERDDEPAGLRFGAAGSDV